jgi:TM2 domain-containing membrane protein YozV
MSEAAAWYYVGSFGQLGPLTLEQMEELIDGSVIEKSTYVWKPSMNDWLPAGNVTELMPAFKLIEPMASPPPMPGTPPPQQQPFQIQQQQQYQAPQAPIFQPQFSQSSSPARMVSVQPHGYPRILSLPKSDKSRTIAGVLQLVIPGAGRMYLGYAALGVIQFLFTACTLVGYFWSLADGIMILSGKVSIDGYGRAIED